MDRKLLVICGPTATGKTRLGLHLAKELQGELISADSRQVYRGMDIGTGKDLPVNSKFQMTNDKLGFRDLDLGFYTVSGVRIWGYDLVEPTDEFSVGQFLKIADRLIEDILKRGKLPILVGGTGLYIKAVVDGIPTAEIPKSLSLRKQYKEKSVGELQEILRSIDPFKLAAMNVSDRNNSRRLIRAIEVGQYKSKSKFKKKKIYDTLFVGLIAAKSFLDKRVEERVTRRLDVGFEQELASLVKNGVNWGYQSMQALGYRKWKEYLSGRLTKDQVIQGWVTDEKNYVKRQITWFKRDKRIMWFDISKVGWRKDVERLVKKWYSS